MTVNFLCRQMKSARLRKDKVVKCKLFNIFFSFFFTGDQTQAVSLQLYAFYSAKPLR